jgi:hypothetical protein
MLLELMVFAGLVVLLVGLTVLGVLPLLLLALLL